MASAPWQTKDLGADYDYLAPDGSEIRLLLSFDRGGLAHCSLPPGGVSAAVRHKTVEEIWYFVEGHGELWRCHRGDEEIVDVHAKRCVSIPTGTEFQFRNTGTEALSFVIATMPAWPGESEAVPVDGHWQAAAAPAGVEAGS
jgi:mannose-6-phosphate isomerase-like protein (cupin superfamily)